MFWPVLESVVSVLRRSLSVYVLSHVIELVFPGGLTFILFIRVLQLNLSSICFLWASPRRWDHILGKGCGCV